MASLCPFEFHVNRSQPELITPATSTPRETKLLSDVDDQQGVRFHVPLIMSYKGNSSMYQNDPVKVIRGALSKTLVHYYPLAGRLRKGPNKKLMVDCNGEGLLFIEADADVTLEQLGDTIQPPCPILEEFLWNVPGSDGIVGCPLILVQVTRLTCGGCIFALRIIHTMFDAMGLSQFLKAVAEMAQGADSPSISPVWERELLLARDPPQITHRHYEYEPIIHSEGTPTTAIDPANLVHQSFCFGPKEIRALRRQLPPHLSTSSRFELITACILKCRTMSLNMKPDEIIRLTCTVNARGKHKNGVVPTGFYGNAFGIPTAVSTVQLVCESPLGYMVELVKESKAKMDEEYIRSFADYLVVKGKPPLPMTWNVLIVSDNTRPGYGDFDFGWGRPVFAGPPRAVNVISFFVRDNNQQEEYGVLVPMCLPKSCVERFVDEFRRMTSNPVEKL